MKFTPFGGRGGGGGGVERDWLSYFPHCETGFYLSDCEEQMAPGYRNGSSIKLTILSEGFIQSPRVGLTKVAVLEREREKRGERLALGNLWDWWSEWVQLPSVIHLLILLGFCFLGLRCVFSLCLSVSVSLSLPHSATVSMYIVWVWKQEWISRNWCFYNEHMGGGGGVEIRIDL